MSSKRKRSKADEGVDAAAKVKKVKPADSRPPDVKESSLKGEEQELPTQRKKDSKKSKREKSAAQSQDSSHPQIDKNQDHYDHNDKMSALLSTIATAIHSREQPMNEMTTASRDRVLSLSSHAATQTEWEVSNPGGGYLLPLDPLLSIEEESV